MTYSNEQFDQLLEERVDGERIDPVFKSTLIDSLEKTMHKKTRFWTRPMVPAAIVTVLLVGVITTVAVTDTFSNGSRVDVAEVYPLDGVTFDSLPPDSDTNWTATPWRVPADWEQEHVSYVAADGFTLPQPVPSYDLIALEITRDNTDPIAGALNPQLLDAPVTEDDATITYAANGETLIFYKDENQSQRMIYQLFPVPSPEDYRNEPHIEKRERDRNIIRAQLEKLPSLSQAETELVFGPSFETHYDVAERVTVNDEYSFEQHGIDFFGKEMHSIESQLIVEAEKTTVDYGSLEDILDYSTWNAYFPAIMWSADEPPEVDVQYEVIDWRFTEDGLELKAQMVNFPEVRDAFTGVDVSTLRERWIQVPLPEEREQLRRDIDAYKQSHPE